MRAGSRNFGFWNEGAVQVGGVFSSTHSTAQPPHNPIRLTTHSSSLILLDPPPPPSRTKTLPACDLSRHPAGRRACRLPSPPPAPQHGFPPSSLLPTPHLHSALLDPLFF